MIYIDASRYNNTEKRTGVENYSYYLINELVKQFGDEIELVTPRKIDLNIRQSIIPFPRLWTHIRLSWFILRRQVRSLFVPSHVLPILCPKNAVITIHDVVFKRFPESYEPLARWYLDVSTRFAVKRAKAIIAPSVATKLDLIEYYDAKEENIHVIPLGAEHLSKEKIKQFRLTGAQEQSILKRFLTWPSQSIASTQSTSIHSQSKRPPRYFVYVGRVEHKKNVDTLLKAFKVIHQAHPDVFLIIAGFKGVGAEDILSQIDNIPFERVIFTGYVSEREKHVLMKHAEAFVFPSRYEGFGIPLLEAMQYKLPIIASDIPSSREILGKEAYFFDTEDHWQLAERMESILTGSKQHEAWLKRYHQKLNIYSWGKCAMKTMEVIS